MKPILSILVVLALGISTQAGAVTKPARPPAKPKKGQAAPKKIYCWDEKGTRICGDSLPASAVNNARTEINEKTGLATKEVARTLTPEEQAAATMAAQQAQELQQQQAQAQQHQQELVLSYANEDELNRAYDEKDAGAKKVVLETSKNIASLRSALIQKLDYATEKEMDKKSTSPKSAESILDLHQQVRLQEANLARQEIELTQLQQERASNLALFRATLAQRQAGATDPNASSNAATVAAPTTQPAATPSPTH